MLKRLSCWIPVGTLLTLVSTAVAGSQPTMNLRTMAVPGSTVKVQTWEEVLPDGSRQPYYAISLDGASFSRPLRTSNRIMLGYAQFDPLEGAPAVPASWSASADNELYIVQFVTQPLEVYRDVLTGMGARVYTFLPENSHIVRMTPAVRDEVSQLPYVRWVGALHPAYRVDGQILADLASGDASPRRYSIQVLERGLGQQLQVSARILALGGQVVFTTPEGFRMEALLTPAQLLAVASMNEVLYVDPWGEPGVDMDIAREIGGANYIETVGNFRGQGVRAEVMDTGLRVTHVDFLNPNPLIHTANSTSTSHGTSVYGIVFGTGTASPQGRGMLPGREQGIIAAYTILSGFGGNVSRHQHTSELVNPNGPYRAVFQTNSWGSAQTTQYTTVSAEMDDLLFLYDIVITQSQSNTGNQLSRPQAWAKNIVSVGGVQHQNTLNRADDTRSGTSTGPASDGRVKPDLTHFYDNIFTTSSSCDTCYTSSFGGTSGATPITAGHFGLLFQMWHERVFRGFGGGASVFDSRPHMTTAKALMINTAYRYNWLAGGPNGSLTRFVQGWGMADVRRLYDERDNLFIVNETDLLTPLGTRTYRVTVGQGQPEFRATLVYADPQGVPGSAMHRINDLSLKVTSPGGTVYWGNNGLAADNWSTPGGTSNRIDTVENVFLQNPQPGQWTVEVLGDEIVQDSHRETPDLDADFALVVTGRRGGCLGDIDGDGVIGQSDLGILLAHYGQNVPPNTNGDLDGDGDVDQQDLGILLGVYGTSCP